MTAQQRRERCEKVHIELHGDCRGCAMTDYIEAFAIEIRNLALEEAAHSAQRVVGAGMCWALPRHIAKGIRSLKSDGRE